MQGDRVVSSLSNVTLKSRETLVEVIIMMLKMIRLMMKMMMDMLEMRMQAGDMLEGLCGEATVEAWLWKPPPGKWVIIVCVKCYV